MIYYHVTSPANAKLIIKRGLLPKTGERSKRISPLVGRAIFVTNTLTGAKKLCMCSLWRTHPDFSDGFVVLEVCSDEVAQRDSMFEHGMILRNRIPAASVSIVKKLDNPRTDKTWDTWDAESKIWNMVSRISKKLENKNDE